MKRHSSGKSRGEVAKEAERLEDQARAQNRTSMIT